MYHTAAAPAEGKAQQVKEFSLFLSHSFSLTLSLSLSLSFSLFHFLSFSLSLSLTQHTHREEILAEALISLGDVITADKHTVTFATPLYPCGEISGVPLSLSLSLSLFSLFLSLSHTHNIVSLSLSLLILSLVFYHSFILSL